MNYYSTNNRNTRVSLKEAVFRGLAEDNGLFMPERVPQLSPEHLRHILQLDFAEASFQLSREFFGEDIPENDLREIVFDALSFEVPLVEVQKNIYTLELFHGPTLAFKDIGARFMARMLSYLSRDYERDINILVATSGDTGSAVANGFLGVEGVKVHILYPMGQVSPLQEKQFTTLGRNITALEIDGSFDDCQRLVKSAFNDKDLRPLITLSSANSISIARLIPQIFYYFQAFRQLPQIKNIAFSVPSGNFGNLTAGLIAKRMGLPVKHFIAATNINDIVPGYLKNGVFTPRPSKTTIANAMDVGNPSNFDRMLDLYNHDHSAISTEISGYAYRDDQIRKAMKFLYLERGYILDPHGAAGYQAASEYYQAHPEDTVVFLETAHPAKFRETVEEVIGEKIPLPERLKIFECREKETILMTREYKDFRAYLRSLI